MPAAKEGSRQRRSLLERTSLPFPNGPPKSISRDMLAAHPPRMIPLPIPESHPATPMSPRGTGGGLSPRVQWAEGLAGGTPRGTPFGESPRQNDLSRGSARQNELSWGSARRRSTGLTGTSPRMPRTAASFGSVPITPRSAALHTPVSTVTAWAELARVVAAPRVTTGAEPFYLFFFFFTLKSGAE